MNTDNLSSTRQSLPRQQVLARQLTKRVQQVEGKKRRRTAIWGSTPVESIYIPGNWALFAEVMNSESSDLGRCGRASPKAFAETHGCTFDMVFIAAATEGLLEIGDIFPALLHFGRGSYGKGIDTCVACDPQLANRLMNPHGAKFYAVFNPDEALPRSVEVSTVIVNVINKTPGLGINNYFSL